jgi:hypothetical protein
MRPDVDVANSVNSFFLMFKLNKECLCCCESRRKGERDTSEVALWPVIAIEVAAVEPALNCYCCR